MRHRGLLKVDWLFTLAMVAYDLVRLPKLLAAVAPSGTTDISPRAIARPRPIRPTAKPAARLIAHYPGSQSALNSAFFSALLVRTPMTQHRIDARRCSTVRCILVIASNTPLSGDTLLASEHGSMISARVR